MNMDSALVVKLEAPNMYSSNGIVTAFRNNFKEVNEFDYQKVMFNEGVEGMHRRLMGMVLMHKPDVTFLHIQTPGPLSLDIIKFLSERTYTVLYTFDVRKDIDWYKEYAPYLGLILFGDQESISELKHDGIENVDYLQSSADFDLYRPLPPGLIAKGNYGEIVFIGNNTAGSKLNFPQAHQREHMVKALKNNFGDRFKAYGLGWPDSKMLNPVEEIAAYQACKIAVTHNNFERTGYTSDRQWRAMGCGACTISHYYKGYNDDIPSFVAHTWRYVDALVKRCETLLGSPDICKHIGKYQQEHVVRNHSWYERIFKLKKLIIKHGYDKRMEDIARFEADHTERTAV